MAIAPYLRILARGFFSTNEWTNCGCSTSPTTVKVCAW
jgi:hypothetical protein